MVLRGIVIGLALAVTTPALCQSASDYEAMGRKAHAAFLCSRYAALALDVGNQKKLFELGMRLGTAYIQAALSPDAVWTDYSDVPTDMADVMGGPSSDFMLGRLWERTLAAAADSVAAKLPNSPSINSAAKSVFQEHNCSFL